MNLIFIYALLYDPSDLYMLHIYVFMYALYIYASRYEECLILTRNTNENLGIFLSFFFKTIESILRWNYSCICNCYE